MNRTLWTLAALLSGPPALAADAQPALSVDGLASEAAATNPSLASLNSRAAALQARAQVAGAWMDPMVGVEYSNAPVSSFWIGDHPMAGVQIRAQQTLPALGVTPLRIEAAEDRAEVAGWARDEAELQLRAGVHRAWWALTRTRLLEAVTRTHLARAQELLAAVHARYEVGAVGQHAVIRLQVLTERLGDEVQEFRRAEAELSAALAGALALAPGAAGFETPTTIDVLPPPGEADWLALAAGSRPELARLDAERRAAEAARALAKAGARPEVTVWAGYRLRTVETETDPGVDLFSLGLSAPIPTGSARRARGEQAAWAEQAAAARYAREAEEDTIEAGVAAALARWTRAHARAATYEDALIPSAQAALETTLSDFSVGRADFASLFEAEVSLLDLERAQLTAVVETHLQRVEIAALIGATPGGGSL